MSDDETIEEVISEDDSEMITVWAPEPSNDSDELLSSSIDNWIEEVKFETTEDVPIPDRLVDQVIGQEAGSIVIRKAAEQRRHSGAAPLVVALLAPLPIRAHRRRHLRHSLVAPEPAVTRRSDQIVQHFA